MLQHSQKIPLTLCVETTDKQIAPQPLRHGFPMTRYVFNSHYKMPHIKASISLPLKKMDKCSFLLQSLDVCLCLCVCGTGGAFAFKRWLWMTHCLAYTSVTPSRRCHSVDNCPAVTNVHLIGSNTAKTAAAALPQPKNDPCMP